MRSGFKTFERSVAELNHLSSNVEIVDAFEPSKDVDFGKRIMQYARKSFQALELDSKKSLDKQVNRSQLNRDYSAKPKRTSSLEMKSEMISPDYKKFDL